MAINQAGILETTAVAVDLASLIEPNKNNPRFPISLISKLTLLGRVYFCLSIG